ncbi:hypothetical protein ACIOKD_18250 [Streptomyces sp. NPDC087844]|uniref:hypothetical protein n=1 Tax=Streptomyces sp. NPDC087844 TaxID=3365805 RepID=UPI0037F52211
MAGGAPRSGAVGWVNADTDAGPALTEAPTDADADAEPETDADAEPETGAAADADADAEPRRDRPARQRVDHLVACLAQRAEAAAGPVREAALGAAELLARYDGLVPQAAAITVAHIDLDAEAEHVDAALSRLAALTAGRPALAAGTAAELAERLEHSAHEGDAEILLGVARRLTAHGGHGAGLIAAALTGALGTRTDWRQPWRAQLRALRRHPVADVRDAAPARTTAYE